MRDCGQGMPLLLGCAKAVQPVGDESTQAGFMCALNSHYSGDGNMTIIEVPLLILPDYCFLLLPDMKNMILHLIPTK